MPSHEGCCSSSEAWHHLQPDHDDLADVDSGKKNVAKADVGGMLD